MGNYKQMYNERDQMWLEKCKEVEQYKKIVKCLEADSRILTKCISRQGVEMAQLKETIDNLNKDLSVKH